MKKEWTKIFPDIVKRRIEEAGCTMRELSLAIGRSQNYVSNAIQNGRIDSEDWKKLDALLKAEKHDREKEETADQKKKNINALFVQRNQKIADLETLTRKVTNLESQVRQTMLMIEQLADKAEAVESYLNVMNKYMEITDGTIELVKAEQQAIKAKLAAVDMTSKKTGIFGRLKK